MKASKAYRLAAEAMFTGSVSTRIPHYAVLKVMPKKADHGPHRDFILAFYGCNDGWWWSGEGDGCEASEHVLPLLLMSEIAKDEERGKR